MTTLLTSWARARGAVAALVALTVGGACAAPPGEKEELVVSEGEAAAGRR